MHRTDKYSQHSSVIWPVWLNSLVFVYEQSSCGIEFRCSLLNFRYRACFEQRVPWDSGNYRVCIHSEMRTWHDKSIQSVIDIFNLEIMQDSVYFLFFFFDSAKNSVSGKICFFSYGLKCSQLIRFQYFLINISGRNQAIP